MPEVKFFVTQSGERWAFGREDVAFLTFSTLDLAVEYAKQFTARREGGAEIVIVDNPGKRRAT